MERRGEERRGEERLSRKGGECVAGRSAMRREAARGSSILLSRLLKGDPHVDMDNLGAEADEEKEKGGASRCAGTCGARSSTRKRGAGRSLSPHPVQENVD